MYKFRNADEQRLHDAIVSAAFRVGFADGMERVLSVVSGDGSALGIEPAYKRFMEEKK